MANYGLASLQSAVRLVDHAFTGFGEKPMKSVLNSTCSDAHIGIGVGVRLANTQGPPTVSDPY